MEKKKKVINLNNSEKKKVSKKKIINIREAQSPAPAAPTKEPGTKPSPTKTPTERPTRRERRFPGPRPRTNPNPDARIQEEGSPAPAAPTKEPGTKPSPTKTPTERPTRRERRFPGPRPRTNPNPDAIYDEDIDQPTIASELKKLLNKNAKIQKEAADFNQNGDYSLRRFWQNPGNHQFGNSPFMRDHGLSITSDHYRYITEKAEQNNWPVYRDLMRAMMDCKRMLDQIIGLERGHEEELIALAKETVAKLYNVDESLFDARHMDQMGGSDAPDQERAEPAEMNDKIRRAIEKRFITETLVHGPALHALQSIHHFEDEEGFSVPDRINQINPQLIDLYDRFGNAITQHYFLMSPQFVQQNAGQLKNMGTGWSNSEYDDEGQPKVKGQGMAFSIITHELIKGLMRLGTNAEADEQMLEANGGEVLTDEEWATVLDTTQALEFEPLYINIGPQMWRKILSSVPEGTDLFSLVQKISSSGSDRVAEFGTVLQSQNEGEIRNYFDNLKNEIEESDFAFNEVIDFTAMTPDQIRNDDINDPDLIKALNSLNEQDVNKLDDARYEALKELVSKSNDANLISRLFGLDISSLTPDQIRELDKDDPSIDKAIGEVNTNELSEEQNDALSELLFGPDEDEIGEEEIAEEIPEEEIHEEEIPEEETGETPDDWQNIARELGLGFSTDDTEERTFTPKGPIEAPEEEMGEEPSDWGSIQNELSSKSLGEMTPDEIRNSTRQELTELLKGFDTNQFSDDQMDAFLDVMA